jgi:hypothetical protein
VCLFSPVLFLLFTSFVRYCLERLEVLQQSDHTAIVTRLFWRFILHKLKPTLCSHRNLQVYGSHASCPKHVLAGTCRIAWRMGIRRLPFPPVLVGRRSVIQYVSFLHSSCSIIAENNGQSISILGQRAYMTKISWRSSQRITCTWPAYDLSIP